MALRKGGASAPSLPGSETLARFTEWRHFLIGLNNGDAMTFNGLTRSLGLAPATMGRILGGGTVPTYQNVDQRRAMLIASSGAANSCLAFRPWFNAPCPVLGFQNAMGQLNGVVSDVPYAGAWSHMGWLRKLVAGSTTHSKTTFGFGDNTILTPSAPIARCGLIGDGALGFRFGSVNCPDGLAGGDNAPGDIDANFIQPAELVNPGANWFHVKVTMFPPTPVAPGKWAAYLNGRLIKVFDLVANLPRGTQAVNRNYAQVEATIYHLFDAGVVPGLHVHDWRVTIDDNAQVPGS